MKPLNIKKILIFLVLNTLMAISVIATPAAVEVCDNAEIPYQETEEMEFFEENDGSFVTDTVIDSTDTELLGETVEDVIREGLKNFAKEIDISAFKIKKNDFINNNTYYYIRLKDSDLYYVDSYFRYYYNYKNIITKIVPKYNTTDKEEIEKVQKQLDDRIDEVIGLTNDSMSDLEKLTVLYNEICLTSTYDHTLKKRSAKDILLDGTAVCEGYASALYMVGTQAGLNVGFVLSEEMKHIWNAVCIDDEWYHVDATWGDPYEDKSCMNLLYDTFLKSDSWMIENKGYKGFVKLENDTTAKYDDYFWNSLRFPFLFSDGYCYYIDGKNENGDIWKFDLLTEEASSIYKFTNTWWVSQDTYRQGTFSGLICYGDRLYFNTDKKILSCELDGTNLRTEYVLDDSYYASVFGCCQNGEEILLQLLSLETSKNSEIISVPFSELGIKIPIEKITLSQTSLELKAGDTAKLEADITPADATASSLTWTSSDEGIATVENGVVTAHKSGTATITATAENGKSATCTVKVITIADTVKFDTPESTVLLVGKTLLLSANAYCKDGSVPECSEVVYNVISGEDCATIDSMGRLKAISAGDVVIRATAKTGTDEAYEDITIRIYTPATKLSLNTTKASLTVGKDGCLQLNATLNPLNCMDTVTWSVDNPEIATVDENGLVTAHAAGKVKITATAGSGKKATCTITVGVPADTVEFTSLKSTSLAVGKTLSLKAKAYCEDGTKPVSTAVVFEIIDGEEYATLDAKGKLKGIATGEVTVRATAEACTEEAYAEVTINVCIPATKVKLDKTKASMVVGGDDLQLTAILSPENHTDTITWTSANEEIATVDENGLVTAHSAGKVKITAMSGSGKKATCTITVGVPATRVDVTALKTKSVAVGKSVTIKGKAACEGKTKPVSTAVVFEIIEGENLATINAKGKLTAIAEGTVVVRVSAEAGTEDAYEDVEINICNPATKIKLNMTKATLTVGDELELEATMTAKSGECTDSLSWTVDKPSIATVDENGVVTAHSAGKVKVTATAGSGKKATCTVTVK